MSPSGPVPRHLLVRSVLSRSLLIFAPGIHAQARSRLTRSILSGTLPRTYVDDPIPAHRSQERRVVPHGRARENCRP